MTKHQWVSLQYTPLEVEVKENGTLEVFATEAAIDISNDEALMACWHCHTPLTAESHETECVAEAASK